MPGRRGEVSPSPAFSVAQQFGTGMGRGTGRWGSPPWGSRHPYSPSQAPLGGQCLCDHGEVVAVPKPCVPTWSHGDAVRGSGLVRRSQKLLGGRSLLPYVPIPALDTFCSYT